ncbi:uncharacterized protein [Magallana gigas]|uniref:uncharacterized protein n=1 Tax=Magallana gigas TaxID=29159 RepID=UPI00333F39C3
MTSQYVPARGSPTVFVCSPYIVEKQDLREWGGKHLNRIMSSSHMDVVPDACIDVLDIMADDDFNFEESIFNLEVKEFGYVANMGCPVADCNFQGTFPSRAKFQRHWEERHVREVQKWACPHQGCKALVRRKSDMKSHLKFTHKETDSFILSLTIAKATSQMVRATNFIDPGLLKYNFRRAETFPTAGVLSLPGFPSMANVAPGTVVIPPPVIEPSSSLEPSSSSLEPSSPSVQTSSPKLDPSSSLLDPSSLPLEPPLTLEPSSLMAARLLSTTELASVSTQTDSKKISLDDYLHKPQSKSTQTYSYCDDDFAIPPIPSSEDSLQMYIVKLGNQIDRIARVRLLAKERLERLQRPGSSLRELESENRAMKRKITELLEREELFPEP